MILEKIIDFEFTSYLQVGKWNKKYNTHYKIGDKIQVPWNMLKTQGKYRWKKIKIKCDDCGKEFYVSIARVHFIDDKNFCKFCIQKGERGHMFGKHHTKEHKLKMSLKFSGKNNPFYGHKHTDEAKEKSRQANLGNTIWKGRKHKKSSIKKLSKTVKTQYRLGLRTYSHGNLHKGYYKGLLFESSYEENFLKHIDLLGIFNKITRGPVIRYKSTDKKIRNYLSDFFFKEYNLVIEIKSSRYWNLDFQNNIKKMNATKRKHYYIVIIDNDFTKFDKIITKYL